MNVKVPNGGGEKPRLEVVRRGAGKGGRGGEGPVPV